MPRLATCWLFAALLPGLPAPLRAQTTAAPICSDSLRQSMAFLKGHWKGTSYSVAEADTTLDALIEVHSQPLFDGCALEERWRAVHNGQSLFEARVTRAYDAPTQRWLVHYADDGLNSQLYEGRREAGEWRFFRTRMDRGSLSWFASAGVRPRMGTSS
jgi:hypothetical protein